MYLPISISVYHEELSSSSKNALVRRGTQQRPTTGPFQDIKWSWIPTTSWMKPMPGLLLGFPLYHCQVLTRYAYWSKEVYLGNFELRTILTASCRTIMSTTSSCQPHHHEVAKCERAGMREFTAESTLGRETLCFGGKVAVRRRWKICLRGCAPRSGKW